MARWRLYSVKPAATCEGTVMARGNPNSREAGRHLLGLMAVKDAADLANEAIEKAAEAKRQG